MKSSIALVLPPTKSFTVTYPLGLAYIGAVLRLNHYDVFLLDFSKQSHALKQCIKHIKSIKPRFIGFTVYSNAYTVVKRMIAVIKAELPETKIILGGPHSSALPLFSLEDTKADFVVVGEGENITLEIVRRIEAQESHFDDLIGVAFWKDGIPMYRDGCNVVDDLDGLPFPAWEILPPTAYRDNFGQIFSAEFPAIPIVTSRGCPHFCSFCASHVLHGRKFRIRSPRNIADEIDLLIKNYGAKEIHILDDTFSESPRRAMDVCREIKNRDFRIKWRAAGGLRLNTLDDELVEMLRSSGCYQVSIGIESISEEVLKNVKKPISKVAIAEKIKMIKSKQIETIGFFILGLPQDTEQTIRQTIRFARDSELDFPIFSQATPLPGSEIFEKKYAMCDPHLLRWDDFHFASNFPFTLCDVPKEKLRVLYFFAYLYTYFCYKRIRKVLQCGFFSKNKIFVKKSLKFMCYLLKGLMSFF